MRYGRRTSPCAASSRFASKALNLTIISSCCRMLYPNIITNGVQSLFGPLNFHRGRRLSANRNYLAALATVQDLFRVGCDEFNGLSQVLQLRVSVSGVRPGRCSLVVGELPISVNQPWGSAGRHRAALGGHAAGALA
jgi:hypothetical protein